MSEVASFQENVLTKLDCVINKVEEMDREIHSIKEDLEDTRLSEEEKKMVGNLMSKIKLGDTSDFVSLKDARKILGV